MAIIFAFSYAFVLSMLAANVEPLPLKVIGFVFAGWMAIAGAMAGAAKFRE